MKNILLHIFFLTFGLISCNSPLPTEIIKPNVQEDTNIKNIEVLSPEPDLFIYNAGYDTLGYVSALPIRKTIISVSGIKTTYKNLTSYRTTAFAVYIDKSQKVETEDGRLLGFASKLIGRTSFNNISSIIIPRIIKYKSRKGLVDTLLGVSHLLTYRRGNNSLFPFPYNSNINYNLKFGNEKNIDINIPTPTEIIGKINVFGRLKNNNLKIEIEWNRADEGKIEIVIGGMNPNSKIPFPLYKFKVRGRNKIIIPKSLVKTFPFDRFKQIMISLVRQKFVGNPTSSKNIVVAQSIHNIKIDVP